MAVEALSARDQLQRLLAQMRTNILGQEYVCERLVLALLADGHVLVEGYPGLAKTRAMKSLAKFMHADIKRIQFTPDIAPSEVLGAEVYHMQGETEIASFRPGPIFAHLIMADEINRAPTQVQAVLLEAMEERQVTKVGDTYRLPKMFMVMATQNPIETVGTFPLPEASKDRFLMNIFINYPDETTERDVMRLVRDEQEKQKESPYEKIYENQIMEARTQIQHVQSPEAIEQRIVGIVFATRYPERFDEEIRSWIKIGASPRGTIALDRCTRARAWLYGREEVLQEDFDALVHDCLRHRIMLTPKAVEAGVTPDHVLDRLLKLLH